MSFSDIVSICQKTSTRLRGTDPRCLEELIEQFIEPRRVKLCDPGNALDIRLNHVPLTSSHVFGVRHGCAVHVTSAPLDSYQVMVPLRGKLVCLTNSTELVASPNQALVYSPHDKLDTYWTADCVALVLSVSAGKLHMLARTLLPRFSLEGMPGRSVMTLTSDCGLSFNNALRVICEESADSGSAFCRGLTSRALEEALLASLLLAHKQQSSAGLPIDTEHYSDKNYMDSAIEYIDQHCADEITLNDLVKLTGVSMRTLQYGFKNKFNLGPMTYIKQLRMHRVRDALLEAPPDNSRVGDIAAQWGFYNGSAFASLYRKIFDELPSETLARY